MMGKRWDQGAATMWAAWRQGLKELAQALPAFPTSVRPVEELGGFANPTQMEVSQDKGEYQRWLDGRRQEATTREPQPPEMGTGKEL
jgi:hypothetical protein